MYALTLYQPWATLIALGVKTIETRSWPPPPYLKGRLLAIHSSVRKPPSGRKIIRVGEYVQRYEKGEMWLHHADTPDERIPLPLGAVVAVGRLQMAAQVTTPYTAQPPPDHITEYPDEGELPHQLGGLWLTGPTLSTPTRIEDQREYGDYRPGRWGWLMTDVRPLETPVPCVGRMRVWILPPIALAAVQEELNRL